MLPKLLPLILLAALFSCSGHTSENAGQQDSLTLARLDTAGVQSPSTIVEKGANGNIQLYEIDNGQEYDNDVRSLGLGLIVVSETAEIFDDSVLQEKFVTINLHESKKDRDIPVYSKFFNPEYDIMHFVCLREGTAFYEILVNHSDIKYLPKKTGYTFQTWKEYILDSYGIRRKTDEKGGLIQNLPLRKQANDRADTLAIPKGLEMFCPMEMKGDWVKVTYDCFYNVNDVDESHEGENCHDNIAACKNPVTGWLRWKQKNTLLIDIFLMP